MNPMHPYQFEQMHQAQEAELAQRARHAWKFADAKPRKKIVASLIERFAKRKDDALKRQAYLVLEEMLRHENDEFRLRAAEIILRPARGAAIPRSVRRS
ncbi:hypothetical protein [Paenibacillus methanolicus]|uniref:Uncharacterized protein n=1 Tax=Paenibacillus methanolicus TaxID=582686 RepID=A0A5S5CA87_9BACL|nr:hypothetical protein [Paenibacillus methanolicus]TYP74903.1 hypothetical protein BCM02_105450 [Paenibacillus methanolicus]